MRIRFAAGLLVTTFLLGACSSDSTTGPTNSPVAGTYNATEFTVTRAGLSPINVLAGGGSLTITIASNNTTTGSLSVPDSIAGGVAFTADMAGTAVVTDSTVTFRQSGDSFVRDLTWAIVGTTLTVNQQVSAGDSYTVTLTRQ